MRKFNKDKKNHKQLISLRPGSDKRKSLGFLDFRFVLIVYFLNRCHELGKSEDLITFVKDRKGHDLRYAIDPTKIHDELGWYPETKFKDGIKLTIKWYLENKSWWEKIISGEYKNYYQKMYGER